MGSNGGNKYIKAKEKREMLWLLVPLSQQMRQKIRHKNSGELQKECVLRHFINI